MSNPYEEFGVTGNVTGNLEELSESEKALVAARKTDVRSGNDKITLEEVDLDEDGNEIEDEVETTEEAQEVETPTDVEEGELVVSEELVTISKDIDDNQEGFAEMVQQAIGKGFTQEQVDSMVNEFNEEGALSEESLKALEAIGYTRKFVTSYIQGQVNLGEQYLGRIMDLVGGKDSFEKIWTHMEARNPSSIAALTGAIDRKDLDTVKVLLEVGRDNYTRAKGNPPKRTITQAGKPAAPTNNTVKAYSNKQEMFKAMRDPRYAREAEYRQEVNMRIIASDFQ